MRLILLLLLCLFSVIYIFRWPLIVLLALTGWFLIGPAGILIYGLSTWLIISAIDILLRHAIGKEKIGRFALGFLNTNYRKRL